MATTLPTTYDDLFRRYADRVPVAYLRALTKRESSFNADNASGSAWGLMQITEIVRVDYNRRHGTNYARADLLDADVNVRMGAELLNRIVASYRRNHTDSNMRGDWLNPEFVKLVTAGWNSGYSEGGGVGKVASYLEARGQAVTHDAVFQFASSAGATRHLSNVAKRDWQRSVAALYFEQPDAGQVGANPLIIAAAVAVGLALLVR